MKSLLILILTLALLAAAFFTRPTETDFRRYFKDQAAAHPEGNWFERMFGGISTDSFLDDCTYQNKYLWTNVVHDGKIIYTGAFSHWIERNIKLDPSQLNFKLPGVVEESKTTEEVKKSSPPAYELKRGK